MSEKELCIEKLQKALLKLPKDDLIKLLKNTYQAMKIKHNIPNQVTSKLIQNPNPNNNKSNKSNTKEQCVNKNSRRNLKLTNLNTINKNPQSTNTNTSTPGKGANFTAMECTPGKGANFTAIECTPGKGANSTLMECTTKETPFGAGTKVTNNTVTKDNMDKYGTGINMDDRFINMETFDTMNKDEMEEEEEITFRSQEFQVQVPELDLTLAHEYINSKHSKNIQKNEEKITTPKFSFYQTTTEGPVGTNTNQFTGNPNTITGTGTVNTANRVNSVNLNGTTGTNSTSSTTVGTKVVPFGAGGVNSIGLYGTGMNNVQYLQGYNGMIWTGGPVNFGSLRPVQIIRRPFYPRSRSLQR
ncbi:uncharacterized protein TA07450 [Theileria annulata]|uniref:Uncharacterized protein n=1 Tax=Theileria annulata TaxID=5874 RepID=Q4UAL2_THEAN|nr:uncharacterized protein TA07450 [Theileria annulata]CAI76139.1 hypothetical protein TA07450 [Theileria annulata]|eukprot:XP_952765.1 hypothetical protein TA07450 [Theileria annulata]